MALNMKKLFGDRGAMGGMPKSISVRSVSMEHDMGEDSAMDDRLLAAKAVLKAIRSNDPESLDMALEEHYKACEESKGDDGYDDSDDGKDSGPDDGEY